MTAYRIAVAAILFLCTVQHPALGQPATKSVAAPPGSTPATSASQPPPDQSPSPVVAPRSDRTAFSLGFAVPVAAPTGPFGANIGAAGGISGSFDLVLKHSMVSLGCEGSYLSYGSTGYEADLGAVAPELGQTMATVVTDHEMVMVHGRVRVQPRQGKWRPYAEVLAGLLHIGTTTHLDNGCSGYYCPESSNASDYAPSFGAGAGFQLRFGKWTNTVKLFDVSVRYLAGGEADYLKPGAIHHVDGQAVYDFSRSRTDMVVVSVGFSFGG